MFVVLVVLRCMSWLTLIVSCIHMLKIASDGNFCLLVGEATVQSLYNTPCYNTDLDITWPSCASLKKNHNGILQRNYS